MVLEMNAHSTYADGLSVNLKEASQELNSLIRKLEQSQWRTDEALVESGLAGIVWHLAAAWNARFQSLQAMNALPSSEFRSLGSAIPNFNGQFTLKSPTT